MMSLPFLTRFVVVLCFLTIASLTPRSQQVRPNPEQQPRKIKAEPKKAFLNWIADVAPILTDEERAAWKKLETDEERERFIAIFWGQRDPDPDTEENEYKDEYYERLAYADEHFSSGKPGRMTDRGLIYLKFGKPDEVEPHPAGATYERPSYEGGGSTSTYPFEKWFYRNIKNISSGIEIEFVDPTGTGEFRMARNPDEKDALIHVPGAGPTLAEMLGVEQRADRIADLGSFGRANYLRAQDSPFETLIRYFELQRVPPLDRSPFEATITGRPLVDENALSFEVQPNYFRQSDNKVLAALTIQTDNRELVFKDIGGLQTARLNIFGQVKSITDQRVGKFEDSVTTSATAAELSELKNRKSAYAKAFILEPGRYRLDVIVRDIESGAAGIQHVSLNVPRYSSDQLSASSLVLAAKLEGTAGSVAVTPFTIGTTKVIPNLSGEYSRSQPVGIYLQVYNAAIDQTTLRPAVDVEYLLLKDGKELGKQKEDWREINDVGQRLTLTRLIDTRSLSPGEYQIQVRIKDTITGQAISPSAKFTIVP
jgi:GWxTD domain-containing protein